MPLAVTKRLVGVGGRYRPEACGGAVVVAGPADLDVFVCAPCRRSGCEMVIRSSSVGARYLEQTDQLVWSLATNRSVCQPCYIDAVAQNPSATAPSAPIRDRILASARALVLDRGFASTTVDAVLTEAGASKGAFFHHFPSKGALG